MAPPGLEARCPTAGRRRSQHRRRHRHRGTVVGSMVPSLAAVVLLLVGPAAGKVRGAPYVACSPQLHLGTAHVLDATRGLVKDDVDYVVQSESCSI